MDQVITDRRSSRLAVRITPQLRDILKRAAELQGRSVSDFVVDTVQEAATKVVADTEVIILAREAQEQIFRMLMDPPEPNERLRQAMQLSRELDQDNA